MAQSIPPLDKLQGLDEHQARDIAQRWGTASGSRTLLDFAETGLVGDRKRLADAILGIRALLKHPFELDRLLHHIQHPCPFEAAARAQGWVVDDRAIYHAHDYDRAISYDTWRACCEAEDIVLNEAGAREDEIAEDDIGGETPPTAGTARAPNKTRR
jgi:hypothetical protein